MFGFVQLIPALIIKCVPVKVVGVAPLLTPFLPHSYKLKSVRKRRKAFQSASAAADFSTSTNSRSPTCR